MRQNRGSLVPMALLWFGLFLPGLWFTITQSFGFGISPSVQGGTLEGYRLLAGSGSLLYTLWVSGISTLLSLFLGTLGALGLWRFPSREGVLEQGYKIYLILPHLGAAYLVFLLLHHSPLFFHPLGWPLILAYTIKEIPFVIVMVLGSLRKVSPSLLQTARLLGGGPLQTFREVLFPHIQSTLSSVFLILFLYTLGAFDIPFFLGGGRRAMISLQVYQDFFTRDLIYRPRAMAALVVTFFFSLLFLVVYFRIARRLSGRKI